MKPTDLKLWVNNLLHKPSKDHQMGNRMDQREKPSHLRVVSEDDDVQDPIVRAHRHKSIYLLPNAFTTAALFCAFFAIIKNPCIRIDFFERHFISKFFTKIPLMEFPKPFKLERKASDFYEEGIVGEQYYLRENDMKYFMD